MIYFTYQNAYCSAEEINEQMAAKVQYITKEEYDDYIKELSLNIELEESEEKEEE